MNWTYREKLCEEDRQLFRDGEVSISQEELTRRKIGRWIKTTSFVQFRNEIRKSVIGQETLDMVLFSIYFYLERVSRGLSIADSILLTAPSGCGKTETYRSVKRYFEKELSFLPCYQIDAGQLTETGFKGADPIYVVGGLLASPETNGIGIVWIDEIDKKVLPSYESRGGNVNAKVQYGLLTILEGSICPPKKESCSTCVDTNNTLFIGLGAFDFVRNNKKHEAVEIGFGKERDQTDHYDVITREDLIEAGACYEFVGRFSSIFSYHKLSENSLRKIIQLMVVEESEMMGIEIKTEESLRN